MLTTAPFVAIGFKVNCLCYLSPLNLIVLFLDLFLLLSSQKKSFVELLLWHLLAAVCRSSLHGRALNRFWSNIEGYKGPLLILVSASSGDEHGGSTNVQKWIVGALMQNGFENRDLFYGSSGSLYAISPVFLVFSSTGI